MLCVITLGRGGVYVETPHGRRFVRPPFLHTPPTPRMVFSGVGGVGLYVKLIKKSSVAQCRAVVVLKIQGSASSKPTTEFAQPRLSRVKRQSSPARGYIFGCVCSYMAGHYPGILMTCHRGHWGRRPLDPTQTGLCKFGCGLGAR